MITEKTDHLSNYGEIKKSFMVTDSDSLFFKNLIIEFNNAKALAKLKPLLPYPYHSRVAADVVFVVKDTATVETASTPDNLQELRRISQSSGQSFEDVVKGMMSQISAHLALRRGANDDGDDDSEEEEEQKEPSKSQEILTATQSFLQLPTMTLTSISFRTSSN
ncbi:zinc finger CCHC domain-containing protein 18-like [Xyrichtys novacula]|uniref:Zinc finger CCHC domain-containing protein 18-like n=1 Tax=Xyrichtys novacula TaxID=13765 RepID=A0AAV1FT16_XYRNO|nr:zinc finger CCHC domain-containing protein 18-like [Xyrichtys novacula]